MKIRPMRSSDIARVMAITREAWGNMTINKLLEDRHGVIGNKSWSEHKADQIKSFCENNPSNIIVAEENGEVTGYATFTMDEDLKTGHICDNAVDPAFQGRGVGTAMNKWIMELFKKNKMRLARVSTMAHDIPAQRIYEKHGFREIARSIHYSTDLQQT